jgi:hypothetical protein
VILYLHGFRSSPQSNKARLIRDAMAARGLLDEFVCPQLPASPRAAAQLVEAAARLASADDLALIGCRAALLNPAIRPYEDLRPHLGTQPVYFSEQTIEVRPEYLDELRALDTPAVTRPERYFLLAATGDELIDWRLMAARYAGCRQRIINGSDHQITDFAEYLDDVLAFCGVH